MSCQVREIYGWFSNEHCWVKEAKVTLIPSYQVSWKKAKLWRKGFPGGAGGKENLTANTGGVRDVG